ncbi:response regulator [Caldichromatium japonicum]|uniref:histidine kinase n=1 Tax=Caldichromatium japonicum TaxID=2699430 RepID=A0A6G7VD95_9GAMM|nr:response regulator [Caldichromatium japonicum]QIK37846.1 response regulator [Caldichromatium japonicum]
MAQVIEILQSQAQAKGLVLSSELVDSLPPLIGDPTRIKQALINYIGNAIKFTERGWVRVRVKQVEEDGQGILLRFEVEDTGSGIAPDVLARLFKPFEQGQDANARLRGGTGLGLAITQHLARLMGGDAGADSTPGVGSLFWFTARLRKAPAPVLTPQSQLTGASAQERLKRHHAGRRVLLVEDEPINQEIARFLLEAAGLTVMTANDGAEAVRLSATQSYDLILMDVQMPGMDGLAATQLIRQQLSKRPLPIIAMTANIFVEDRERCLAAGMDGFLPKPVRPETLYDMLDHWLSRSQMRREAADPDQAGAISHDMP